jgi:hypothetical protein
MEVAQLKFKPKGKRKLGKLQLEWNREMDLLNRRIRAAERQGYTFPDKAFVPERGARASRSKIERLRQLRKDALLQHAVARVDGREVKGTEVARRKRHEAAKKARAARKKRPSVGGTDAGEAKKVGKAGAELTVNVYRLNVGRHAVLTYYQSFQQYQGLPFYDYIMRFLEQMEDSLGEEEFISTVMKAVDKGVQPDFWTCYNEEAAHRFVVDFTGILEKKGYISPQERAEVAESFEIDNWQDYDK